MCNWFAAARAQAADIDQQLPAPRTSYQSISAAGARAEQQAASC